MKQRNGGGGRGICLTKAAFQFHIWLRSLVSCTGTDMTLGLAGGFVCTTRSCLGGGGKLKEYKASAEVR